MLHIINPDDHQRGYSFMVFPGYIEVSYVDRIQDVSRAFIISKDDIMSRRNFSSCTLWAVDRGQDTPYELLRHSFSSKVGMGELLRGLDREIYDFFIFFPNEDATFLDCPIIVYEGAIPTVSNISVVREAPDVDIINKVMPLMKLTQTGNMIDTLVPVTLEVLTPAGQPHFGQFDTFIEAFSGYLPIRRFQYEGSPINFNVSFLHMPPDTPINVRAGFKYFSNVANLDIIGG